MILIMITPVTNTLIPRQTFLDKETNLEWLYFDYDGTFQDYKKMPNVVQKNNVYFIKVGHNSDTLNVTYRETPKSQIVFTVVGK